MKKFFKKPITQFTFQDGEYITVSIANLLKKLFELIGKFVDGIQNGDMFDYDGE